MGNRKTGVGAQLVAPGKHEANGQVSGFLCSDSDQCAKIDTTVIQTCKQHDQTVESDGQTAADSLRLQGP